MSLDVMEDAMNLSPSLLSAKYHYMSFKDNNSYTSPLTHLSYFSSPIDRLAAIQQNDEGVELLITPGYPTEMPRSSMSLRHHTSFKQHNVLSTICVEDEDNIITSSALDDPKKSGGYISVWDIPTAEERADGTQFLAVMTNRYETDFPHDQLEYSVREEVLFSGSLHSGALLCTRITTNDDRVPVSEDVQLSLSMDPNKLNLPSESNYMEVRQEPGGADSPVLGLSEANLKSHTRSPSFR